MAALFFGRIKNGDLQVFLNICAKKAMDDIFLDTVLTNCEDLNVYNELVHKNWR